MDFQRWKSLAVIVAVVLSLGVGAGYWVNAAQHMEDGKHGMESGRHDHMMSNGQHKGMMGMPMMHADMSEEEMNEFCTRMQQRHKTMKTMRQKNTEELNSLVQSMKQADGTNKIEAMEKVLIELVEQHNKRGKMMMGSMHSMMGSMMEMQRMNSQNRQQMMNQMENCPMMQGMMKSGQEAGNKSHHG